MEAGKEFQRVLAVGVKKKKAGRGSGEEVGSMVVARVPGGWLVG